MKLLLLVFVISSAAALETYTETRDITDPAGNSFSSLSLSYPPLLHWRLTRKPATSQTPQATPSPASTHLSTTSHARLSTGSRARCNATRTPMENRRLRTSSLLRPG